VSPTASLLDKSRVEIKLGAYGVAQATALSDPTLLSRAQEYRRLSAGRMQAIGKDDIKAKLPVADYHVSRKVDGEFAILVVDGKDALVLNPGGTVRVGAPFLDEAVELVAKAGLKRALLAGELTVERPDGKRSRVHDVARVARTPDSAADIATLRFAVFDFIEIDGKPPTAAFADTWKRIDKTFGAGKAIRPVETVVVKKLDEIERKFDEWVEKEGAEGLVVRSDTAGLYKIKPRHTIDAAVIGFTEATEDRKGMLHDLLVALMRPDGTFHTFTRVGGGFTEDERRAFLSDLKDMACESEYAEVNPDHIAYQMVAPQWVIEMSCLDFVSQTTRGATIDRMVLQWDTKSTKYGVVRRLPLASAIAPQFVRKRDDKQIQPQDLRLQQVADLVEVPMADRDAKKLTMPKSQVLRREAYTKVLKGQTMVRKLLLWKTNKETEGGDFPAYVIHFTDFSPNRKTPLEREIRISNSREQIDALWGDLAKEYIVKGWVKA
jgi:hypothetical protein